MVVKCLSLDYLSNQWSKSCTELLPRTLQHRFASFQILFIFVNLLKNFKQEINKKSSKGFFFFRQFKRFFLWNIISAKSVKNCITKTLHWSNETAQKQNHKVGIPLRQTNYFNSIEKYYCSRGVKLIVKFWPYNFKEQSSNMFNDICRLIINVTLINDNFTLSQVKKKLKNTKSIFISATLFF
jgi:hypothetical protein